MTNKEKMFAGQVYDPNDEELVSEQFEYLNAMKAYNALPYGDKREEEYLRKCFGAIGKQPVVTQPFFANWGGKHVFIGDYFYSNFNLTLVDDGKIEIGDNVMIGPNVSIITAGHPVSPKCRLKGLQYNADVKIGNNVWIGAGVNVLPILKELFKDLSKAVKPALRPLVKNAYHILPLALKVLPDSLSSQVKAFLSTTMVFTMAEGSHASNNIPDAAWVLANLRFSPQEGHDKCMKKLEKVAKKYDIEIEVLNTRDASPCTDTKSEGYKFTVDMINKTYGDTVLAPYLIAGGTDCRYMQDICSTALRFTPFLVSLEELGACHGYNERIGVDSLAQGVDFYRNVLTNFK